MHFVALRQRDPVIDKPTEHWIGSKWRPYCTWSHQPACIDRATAVVHCFQWVAQYNCQCPPQCPTEGPVRPP